MWDLHGELEDATMATQVRQHFGVDFGEEPETEDYVLEGLVLLAVWELEEAYWAEGEVGGSDTARAYNKAARWIDHMVWDPEQDNMFVGHPGHRVTVGRFARDTAAVAHPVNVTLNLLMLLEGEEVVGDAAEDALDSKVFEGDDEALLVLSQTAQRF